MESTQRALCIGRAAATVGHDPAASRGISSKQQQQRTVSGADGEPAQPRRKSHCCAAAAVPGGAALALFEAPPPPSALPPPLWKWRRHVPRGGAAAIEGTSIAVGGRGGEAGAASVRALLLPRHGVRRSNARSSRRPFGAAALLGRLKDALDV